MLPFKLRERHLEVINPQPAKLLLLPLPSVARLVEIVDVANHLPSTYQGAMPPRPMR
jgi:hypothetical protein